MVHISQWEIYLILGWLNKMSLVRMSQVKNNKDLG